MWSGEIHNQDFVTNLLGLVKKSGKNFKTSKRIKGFLEGIVVENQLGNRPLSVDVYKMSSEIKSHNIPKKHFISAVASLGFSIV